MSVRRFGAGAALAGGAAVAAAIIGAGIAYADNGTDQINGWTVTPADGGGPLSNDDTLSDPGNSLGLGTAPITGNWISAPASPLSSIGSNDQFATLAELGTNDKLFIFDTWLPGIEEATVQTGKFNNLLAFLVPALDGKQVVDLVNFEAHDAPPLVNPDATGPIEVGGVELASPHDGALLNNLVDAVFMGDAAAWGKAATLFDDWLGTDPSDDAGASSATTGSGEADTNPADPLSSASTNLTDANTVLSGADLSGNSELAEFVTNQTQLQDTLLGVLGQLESAEGTISAHVGSLSSLVDQLFFDPLNQGWASTTEGILTADQLFDSALTAGSGAEGAALTAAFADLPVLADFFGSLPVIIAADFF